MLLQEAWVWLADMEAARPSLLRAGLRRHTVGKLTCWASTELLDER